MKFGAGFVQELVGPEAFHPCPGSQGVWVGEDRALLVRHHVGCYSAPAYACRSMADRITLRQWRCPVDPETEILC